MGSDSGMEEAQEAKRKAAATTERKRKRKKGKEEDGQLAGRADKLLKDFSFAFFVHCR